MSSTDQAPAAEQIVSEVTRLLRERGERMTGPRRIVLTALAQEDDHVSAEDLVTAVADLDASVHRASVYRTLEALCDLGVVQHVHIGHGSTAYHLIPETGPHPHAQCRVCARLYDLPVDLLDAVAGRLARQDGFVLDTGHVALSGTCTSCVSA